MALVVRHCGILYTLLLTAYTATLRNEHGYAFRPIARVYLTVGGLPTITCIAETIYIVASPYTTFYEFFTRYLHVTCQQEPT